MRAALQFAIELIAVERLQVVARSASLTTQTMLERSPGSGTVVNGPCSVWNSVEMSRCGRLWATL